jgi:hypothetical protein
VVGLAALTLAAGWQPFRTTIVEPPRIFTDPVAEESTA